MEGCIDDRGQMAEILNLHLNLNTRIRDLMAET